MKLSRAAYEDYIECPECMDHYCHPGKITEKHEDSSSRPSDMGRGRRIIIRMMCEGGHRFEIHIQFHKGITYTWTVSILDPVGLPSEIDWTWLE
jgi:hypothetical protein